MANELPNGTLGVAKDTAVMAGDPNETRIVQWASNKILVHDTTIGPGLPGVIFLNDVEIGSSNLGIGPRGETGIIGKDGGRQFVFIGDFAIFRGLGWWWGR